VAARANQAPVAAFTNSCTNLSCSFDATGSSDPDGTVAAYAWNFGDQTTGTGATASHAYTAAGTYTATLTVTDDKGATGTTTKTVTVALANVKPTASFTSSCGTLSCSFDASGSTDSDGTVARYDWSFGDGTSGTGKTTSHPYTSGGTYSVKLTVTDNQGATDTSTQQVTVNGPVAVAADQFTRSGTGWGTADTGGAWSLTNASSFSTNGSSGLIKLASAGSTSTATLSSVSASDVTVTADLSADKAATGNGTYVDLVTRRSGTSYYMLKARLMADGTVHLAGSRTTNGSESTLKEVLVNGMTYTPGTVLRVKFTVAGTSSVALSGKVWAAGGTEPTGSQFSFTDSSAPLGAAGAVGVYANLSSTSTAVPVTVAIDNFSAVKS
jgi:PKD repeat protein